jgi:hypothetical protein
MTDCEGPPKEKPHHGLGRGGVPGPITDRGGRGATEATLVGGTVDYEISSDGIGGKLLRIAIECQTKQAGIYFDPSIFPKRRIQDVKYFAKSRYCRFKSKIKFHDHVADVEFLRFSFRGPQSECS